ncbi:hypothetical protein BJX70DRAFT_338421 [Aspergillus crustosus]
MATETPEQSRLLALPTELVVEIFQAASSFKTALNLAVTSKPLYAVWQQYSSIINTSIAPSCIGCYSTLRELLSDLGEVPADKQLLTIKDISRIVEIARVGDDLVDCYTRVIQDFPYPDPQVSKNLSTAERRRFIRAHYQIIGLMTLELPEQQERIKNLNLKTLFSLSDFLCVFYPEGITDDDIREMLDNSEFSYRVLQRELRIQRNQVFKELYGHNYNPRATIPYEQEGRTAWWCDRQQASFKQMITGRVYSEKTSNEAKAKSAAAKVRDDLWYDSEEE